MELRIDTIDCRPSPVLVQYAQRKMAKILGRHPNVASCVVTFLPHDQDWHLRCQISTRTFHFSAVGDGWGGHDAVDDLIRKVRAEMRQLSRNSVADYGADDLNSRIGAEQIAALNGEPWERLLQSRWVVDGGRADRNVFDIDD